MIKKEKSAWSKFREKENSRSREAKIESGLISDDGSGTVPEVSAQEFEAMLKTVDELIGQITQLYNMYANGVERAPPRTHVTRLESMMKKLDHAYRSSSADKFRYSQLKNKLNVYRERWEKSQKSLEKK